MTFPIPDDQLEAEARTFAYLAHASVDHYRKTTNAPYVFHLEEVALIVREVQGCTPQMIAAALLHDVLEDTPVTKSQLKEKFGWEISYLVEGMSDVSTLADGDRPTRKAIDRNHYAAGDWRIHTIKCADTISNTRDIVLNDPGFARVYLPEIRELLKLLTKADPCLRAKAIEMANQELPEKKIMGGNALKLTEAARLTSEEYYKVRKDIVEALDCAFDRKANIVPISAYKNKPDFGDIDILIADYPQDVFDKAYSALNATEGSRNGDVMSFGYPLGDGRVFQVDLIKTRNLLWAYTYFSFNDLGNLMGRVSKKLGFKYGHDGLWYVLRDPKNDTRVIEELLVTDTNFEVAFYLLGYDYRKWLAGPFDELEDIYRYAASNVFFDLNDYLLENRPHHERMRDRKRKVYVGFLEWCKTQTFTLSDEAKAMKEDLREASLRSAFQLFPEFKAAYDRAIGLDSMKKEARKLFNHELIQSVTGAQGKQLGLVIKAFTKAWFTPEHFNHWCVTVGEELVHSTFKDWWTKESKDQNSELMIGFNIHAENMRKGTTKHE